MRKVNDTAAYELHEEAIAAALVEAVRRDLERAGLRGKALKATTESVAFSVAAIYDGSAHVAVGEDHAVPVLGFAVGRMRDRLLAPASGGSSIHGFVAGAVEEHFKR